MASSDPKISERLHACGTDMLRDVARTLGVGDVESRTRGELIEALGACDRVGVLRELNRTSFPALRSVGVTMVVMLIVVGALLVWFWKPWELPANEVVGITNLLEEALDLRSPVVKFVQGRATQLEFLKPSARAKRLVSFIPARSTEYQRGLVAFATEDYDEARALFERLESGHSIDAIRLNRARAALEFMAQDFDAAVDILERAVREAPDEVRFLDDLGYAYTRLGRYEEAVPYLERAAGVAERDSTLFPLNVLITSNNLSFVHEQLENFDAAEAGYRKSVAHALEVYGRMNTFYVSASNLLADLLKKRGRYKEALAIYEETIDIRSRRSSGIPFQVAFLRAKVAAFKGDYRGAKAHYERGLTILREDYAADHTGYLQRLLAYSVMCESVGAYAEAEAVCREAITRLGEALGEDHPFYGKAWIRFAGLRHSQGRYPEAIEASRKALGIVEAARGLDHPEYAAALSQLGVLLSDSARFDDAEEALGRALSIAEERFGAGHRMSVSIRVELAGILRKRAKFDDAYRVYSQVLDVDRETVGETHLDYAYHLYTFALLCHVMGRYEESEARHLEAIDVLRAGFGDEHPNVLVHRAALASLYRSMGRFEEAEESYKAIIEGTRRGSGEEHKNVAANQNNLGLVYESAGRLEDALEQFEIARDGLTIALGEQHPFYAKALANCARIHLKQGRVDAAVELFDRVLDLDRQFMDDQRPIYAFHLNNAAGAYRAAGQTERSKEAYEEALAIVESVLGPAHLDTGVVLGDFAALLAEIDDFARSNTMNQRAKVIEKTFAPAHSFVRESYITSTLMPW